MDFFTTANGIAMRASDIGKGNVVVLLHGYLETMDVWGTFAETLSATNRVIALDLPGSGLSEYDEKNASMDFIADCIKALLDKQKVNKCAILGHSMGGYAALAFAKKYPEITTKIILFSSLVTADSAEKQTNRNREINLIRAGKLDLILRANIPRAFADINVKTFDENIFEIEESAKFAETEGIVFSINAMKNRADMSDFVKTAQSKTMFIFGKYDNYIPLETAQKIAQTYPNAKTITLENSGHNGFIEEPLIAAKMVSDFV